MHAPHVSERELDQLKAAAAGQAPKAAAATRQAPAAKAGGGGLFGGLFGGGGGGGGGGAEVLRLLSNHECMCKRDGVREERETRVVQLGVNGKRTKRDHSASALVYACLQAYKPQTLRSVLIVSPATHPPHTHPGGRASGHGDGRSGRSNIDGCVGCKARCLPPAPRRHHRGPTAGPAACPQRVAQGH